MATLQALINEAHKLRERKREIEADLKQVETALEAAKKNIIEAMTKEGLDKATSDVMTVSIGTRDVPQFDTTDPDAYTKFERYVYRHKALHLLDRRLSVSGCRELWELGRKISGVVPFTKIDLLMRNINHGND